MSLMKHLVLELAGKSRVIIYSSVQLAPCQVSLAIWMQMIRMDLSVFFIHVRVILSIALITIKTISTF